jgi:pilus assembly protein CpaF
MFTTAQIFQETTRHFLGPVLPLLDDETVSEIMINGPADVFFERAGKVERSGLSFPDAPSLMAAVRNIAEYVNRPIDADHPTLDARLPDGSRVNVIIPPSARQGVCVSIRKFQKSSFDLDALVSRGSLTAEAAEFLGLAVLLHKNTVISGGTGTGKTSMLNALSARIPPSERIIVIEDSSELQLNQPHTVYLEAQPARPDGKGQVTIRDLFVNSLRMRPDRIVVGEVRRGEALDLIQSMLSGHAGSLTTVHASTPRDALVRLETLCLLGDVSIPAHVARLQVGSAVHVVLQIARFPDGSRRVQAISEVVGLDPSGSYLIEDLYRFQGRGRDDQGRIIGELVPTGRRPSFADEPAALGVENHVKLTARLFRTTPGQEDEAEQGGGTGAGPPDRPDAGP